MSSESGSINSTGSFLAVSGILKNYKFCYKNEMVFFQSFFVDVKFSMIIVKEVVNPYNLCILIAL